MSSEIKPLNYRYDYSFRQSPENPQCWKQRLAWFLRNLANRLDRRDCFALRFQSDPPLPKSYRNSCIERGMKLSFELMAESVQYESMNERLREEMPHLWDMTATNSEKE